jgi:hypothetical protein
VKKLNAIITSFSPTARGKRRRRITVEAEHGALVLRDRDLNAYAVLSLVANQRGSRAETQLVELAAGLLGQVRPMHLPEQVRERCLVLHRQVRQLASELEMTARGEEG